MLSPAHSPWPNTQAPLQVYSRSRGLRTAVQIVQMLHMHALETNTFLASCNVARLSGEENPTTSQYPTMLSMRS